MIKSFSQISLKKTDDEPKTLHKTFINCLKPFETGEKGTKTFVTSDLLGNLFFWKA